MYKGLIVVILLMCSISSAEILDDITRLTPINKRNFCDTIVSLDPDMNQLSKQDSMVKILESTEYHMCWPYASGYIMQKNILPTNEIEAIGLNIILNLQLKNPGINNAFDKIGVMELNPRLINYVNPQVGHKIYKGSVFSGFELILFANISSGDDISSDVSNLISNGMNPKYWKELNWDISEEEIKDRIYVMIAGSMYLQEYFFSEESTLEIYKNLQFLSDGILNQSDIKKLNNSKNDRMSILKQKIQRKTMMIKEKVEE